MNLIIDQGNTAIKVGVFDKNQISLKEVFSNHDSNALSEWLKLNVNEPVNLIISNVTSQKLDVSKLDLLISIELNSTISLPIKIAYKSPETLGNDRLANACGMWSLNKGKNSLSLDFGTCLKYDLINNERTYLGGAISPGLGMRYRALHEFTAKLPLIQNEMTPLNEVGDNTDSSLCVGVKLGMIHEINGFIERYSEDFDDLTIFMTGGDLKYFDKDFKNHIFANPDLTMIGLNEILQYNVQQK